MKLVDSGVISKHVEFIFNLQNIAVTKHFFFLIKLSNLSQTPCMYIYMVILSQFNVLFELTLLNYPYPISKLNFPMLRQGSIEERTQQIKNLTLITRI